jgi:hypothetical protein
MPPEGASGDVGRALVAVVGTTTMLPDWTPEPGVR